MKCLIKDREEALATHELARTRMIDRRKRNFTLFRKGDKVWLDSRNLQTLYHRKMAPKREGPFEIMEVIGPVTYQLKLPTTWKVHNVFHASLLRQYKENEVYRANFDWPPAELIGKEVYEVETILKHRKQGQRYQYFVKWKGYPITEALWEPEEVFIEAESLLDQYKLWHWLWIENHTKPSPAPHCTTALRSLIGTSRTFLINSGTCTDYLTI